MTHSSPEASAPLVAVIIPALNEAGKIGRVLDKMPRDGRFEAIVVDDGSTDGTGDEARAHGAALVIRHEVRGGVGAAIRDGWLAGIERGRPYLALLSGDDQHEPAELGPALDTLLGEQADYVQGSRWMPGGRIVGMVTSRQMGTRIYSFVFSLLALRRVTDATNGFRIFRSEHPGRSEDRHPPGLAGQLRPRAVRPVQGDPARLPRDRGPGHRPLPRHGGLHEDARPARLVAPLPARGPAPTGGQTMTFQPDRAFGGRRILVTGGAGFVGGRRRQAARGVGRARHRPRRPVHRPGRDHPDQRPVRARLGDRRGPGPRARGRRLDRLPPRRPQHHRLDEEPARRLRDEHRRHPERAPGRPRVAGRTASSTPRRRRSTATRARSRSTRTTGWSMLSPYAVSKLGGEHYCQAFYESYGLPRRGRPLLERLRPRPAPGQSVLRRRLQVLRQRDGRRAAPDPRRRHADPRLHLHRRCRRGDAAGGHPPARRGRGLQRRHRHRDLDRRSHEDDRPGRWQGSRCQVTSTGATSTTSGAAS